MIQLVLQDRGQFFQALALEIGGRRDEPLRDRIDDTRRLERIRSAPGNRDEVAVLRRANPELLAQLLPGFGYGAQVEIDAPARPYRRRRRSPGQADQRAHRLADGAFLKHDVLVDIPKTEPPGAIPLEPI